MTDVNIVMRAQDEASRVLNEVASSVDNLSNRLMGAAGLVAGAAGAVLGGRALIGMAEDATEAFVRQTKATRDASDGQQAFAARVQSALGVGDELVLQLMQQARILGVTEDKLDDVALAAIGVAEATGQNLQAVVQSLASDEDKLADSLETARRGLELKKQAAGELDGVMQRSSNAVTDLKERVGELLAPFQRVIHTGLAVFAETAEQALVPAIEMVSKTLGALGDIAMFGARGAIAAVTAVEVAFTEFGTLVDIVMKTAELAILNFVGEVQHFFTVALPQYGAWLGRNWVNLFIDIGNSIFTIWKNMVQKLGNVIFEFWMFVESGFEGGLARLGQRISTAIQGSLLEGFEARTEALPDIVGRKLTAREQQLATQVGAMANHLGETLNEKFQARVKALDAPGIDLNLDGSGGGAGLGGGQGGQLTAVESRLLTRGPGDDPLNRIEDHTKRTADGIDRLVNKQQQRPINIKRGKA